jgi:hypothetical protein
VAKILIDFVAGPIASLHRDFLKKPMKRQCETRPSNNLDEARRIQQAVLAARDSLETGRVVSLYGSGTVEMMGGDPYGNRADR